MGMAAYPRGMNFSIAEPKFVSNFDL